MSESGRLMTKMGMYLFLHGLCNCSIFVCSFIYYGIVANEQMDHLILSAQLRPLTITTSKKNEHIKETLCHHLMEYAEKYSKGDDIL